jgi:hypothetical protein
MTVPSGLPERKQDLQNKTIETLQFLTKFKSNYLRNNRLSTQKNLRCFPSCPATGHCTTGSCSCGCIIQLAHATLPHDKYIVVAEIAPKNNPNTFKVGNIYRKKFVETAQSHGGQESTITAALSNLNHSLTEKDCWRATLLSSAECDARDSVAGPAEFMYLVRPSYWHYGWRSHKHMRQALHNVRIYAFSHSPQNVNSVECIAEKWSSPFTVNSYKGQIIADSKKKTIGSRAGKRFLSSLNDQDARTQANASRPLSIKRSTSHAYRESSTKKRRMSSSGAKELSSVLPSTPSPCSEPNALLGLAIAALGSKPLSH